MGDTDGKGGARVGSGRKSRYPGGTTWVTVPIPTKVAQEIKGTHGDLKAAIIHKLQDQYLHLWPST